MMKSLRSMGLAFAALATFAPLSAHADVPVGWYTGLNTNMSFERKGDSEVNNVTDEIKYKNGWGIGAYAGYGWGYGIRTEGELIYRHASVDGVFGQNTGTDHGGGIHNTALMANALYELKTGYRLTPYVGFGIGGANVKADNMRLVNGATLDGSKIKVAYQGIAGFAFALEGNWDFTADYRYFATPDVKFDTNTAYDAKTENASHNLMMGIRYRFAAPAKPAPAPEPPPAPAPAPKAVAPVMAPPPPKVAAPAVAPVPQSYMVFFDFDKSVLTPEAKRIIASAAEDFKRGRYIRLVVTGHTDTMGTDKYNQRLSERRAASVRAEFERLGVPAAEVATSGMGEHGLLVPTNNQVREAQNRRAEIVLKQQ